MKLVFIVSSISLIDIRMMMMLWWFRKILMIVIVNRIVLSIR